MTKHVGIPSRCLLVTSGELIVLCYESEVFAFNKRFIKVLEVTLQEDIQVEK
jgi:hypothetical protein